LTNRPFDVATASRSQRARIPRKIRPLLAVFAALSVAVNATFRLRFIQIWGGVEGRGIRALVQRGAISRAYDPVARDEAARVLAHIAALLGLTHCRAAFGTKPRINEAPPHVIEVSHMHLNHAHDRPRRTPFGSRSIRISSTSAGKAVALGFGANSGTIGQWPTPQDTVAWRSRRVNIQDARGKAKPYQVRQVLQAIEKLEGRSDES